MAPPPSTPSSWPKCSFDIDWPYPSNYRMKRVLARGVNSTVYLGKPRWRYEADRAIKCVEISKEDQLSDELSEEERLLKRCGWNLFLVWCVGSEIARDAFDPKRTNHNLILEYANNGTLKEKIMRRRGLRVSQVREVAKDILQGIETIHGNNIVHLDINPKNILQHKCWPGFRRYNNISLIADFGSAMEADSELPFGHRLAHRSRDTRYHAPELHINGPISFAVDIWAFGCTVLEMLTGQPPWKQYERYGKNWRKEIGNNEVPYIPEEYCDDTKDFLRNCFNRNPEERSTSLALLNHPFLTIPDDGDVDEEEEAVDGDA